MRGRTKVSIFLTGLVWAQVEEGPQTLVVYDALFDRFFQIKSWTPTPQTQRPDTVLYLQVQGTLPSLERFPNLKALYLSAIEELDLRQLTDHIRRYCPKLKALALEDCDIPDLTPLAELPLEGLLVDDNPIADLSPLTRAKNLRFLSVARTDVQDITPLVHMPQVEGLDLSETAVRDLSPLSKLAKLRMVALFRCTAVADFSPLLSTTNLEFLNVSHTQATAVRPLLTQIGRFAGLKVLQAQGVITDPSLLASLSTLSQMEELTLGQNPAIEDLTFVRLLRRLLYLDVHSCAIRNLSPLAGLPHLVKLSIGKNQIQSLAPLTQCPRLAYLYCYNNPITDWEKLLEIPALTYVMLSRKDLPPEKLQTLKAQLRKKGITVDAP
ncbi:MAG: hypothetical protein KatS3mg025_1017 [Bacteroidia bacterium]|nr:MAG: hypothetical protein KatS3mg025_1017 [Bacteroidia bacterium]